MKILLRRAGNALRRLEAAARRAAWRLRHAAGPHRDAAPAFILGAQRSGTTMLGECLGRSGEVVYYPEHDTRAFHDFELREDIWRRLVADARQPVCAFKPLTSSHRADEWLAEYPAARVVWMFRHPSDRARSAVNRFGEQNLRLLRALAAGERPDVWQTRGLDEAAIARVIDLQPARLDAAGAAALFWYLRNQLFFTQGLDREPRALLMCYERFTAAPREELERLCRHLGITPRAHLVRGIHARSVRCEWPAQTDPRVRELCDALYARLLQALR